MKTESLSGKISVTRPGLRDMWNAFMVEGAQFSSHDLPLCPTTAIRLPSKLTSYAEAKKIHKSEMKQRHYNYHVDAFVHFYEDDQNFDGKRTSIWLYPQKALSIIRHYSGIFAPDFSTNADFPIPLKVWNFYRMNAFGYWIGSLGIPVISNCRWGTEETWDYCFDGNPRNSIVSIGSVASGIRRLRNRPLFEAGLFEMVKVLRPHTIVVYGSANYRFFDTLRSRGIQIVSYPSKTSQAYAGRERDE